MGRAMAYEDEEVEAALDPRIIEAVQMLASKLGKTAMDEVAKKKLIEERWLNDMRRYHGRYDPETLAKIEEVKGSKVFIKETMSKTHAWEARLSDMLFPTDDRNWGISPTPDPTMSDEANEAAKKAEQFAQEANKAMEGGDAAMQQAKLDEGNEAAAKAREIRLVQEEADKRSTAMDREIDDQLTECNYNVRSRDAIEDLCRLGTAVMKGPITAERTKRRWRKVTEEVTETDGAGNRITGIVQTHKLEANEDPRPEVRRVDPWNFFPDMSAPRAQDAEYTFERHPMSKKELKKLAKRPGFNEEAIRDLLEAGPSDSQPDYIADLRSITGDGQNSGTEQRYLVWEYHGPLEQDEVRDIAIALGDNEQLEEIKIDPLDEYNVIIWFCGDKILKFGPHPMESGETMYSVANFVRSETSMFGHGVPSLMEHSQAAINGAWRMMMDNGALSVGPQVVTDEKQIEPTNGDWTLSARKNWRRIKDANAQRGPAFEVFNITSNQGELAGIINLARQFMDDETNLPLIAHGDSASHVTKTEGGMAMLMNSVNVIFRRVVRNWDDDMTTPTIRRFYDWNMQFSRKEEIKGDFEVRARGSSVLLVREVQGRNLMSIAVNWSVHPVLKDWLRNDAGSAARKALQANMVEADEIMLTDEEHERQMKKNAENAEKPFELQKLEAEAVLLKAKIKADLEIANIKHRTEMMRLAEQKNMKLDDLMAKLDLKGMDVEAKERALAAEIADKERTGVSGGGSV